MLLETQGLTRHFGGLPALRNISFRLEQGEILGLIGPNGAGKSTLLHLLSGIIPPSQGRLFVRGGDVTGLKPHQMVRRGVARVLQTPRSFPGMSIWDNVAIGALFARTDRPHAPTSDCHSPEFLLELVGLLGKRHLTLENLTLQERRMLELARALATRPDLLLLDEAMSGLNPTEMEGAMALIRRIRSELGMAIIWVEHAMKAVMGVVDRVLVLNFGEVIATGTPREVSQDQLVISAYLGKAG